jgi:hypothetical protein
MNEVDKIASMSRLPVGVSRYYLHTGQVFATDEPYAVTTILGSCVAVCLWDDRSQVAGRNRPPISQKRRIYTEVLICEDS